MLGTVSYVLIFVVTLFGSGILKIAYRVWKEYKLSEDSVMMDLIRNQSNDPLRMKGIRILADIMYWETLATRLKVFFLFNILWIVGILIIFYLLPVSTSLLEIMIILGAFTFVLRKFINNRFVPRTNKISKASEAVLRAEHDL